MEAPEAVVCVALLALGEEADRRGTSLHVHHCPRGDWLVYFGEADRVVKLLAQESDFVAALIAACGVARAN